MKKAVTTAITLAAAVCLIGCGQSIAQAGTLYSQPSDDTDGPSGYDSYTNQQIADPFSIAGGGTINQVSWYGGSPTNTFSSAFDVIFYASTSSGSVVGAALETITDATPTPVYVTGGSSLNGVNEYLFTLNVPSFVAAAGTGYFFSVVEDTPTSNFFWIDSADGTTSQVEYPLGGFRTGQVNTIQAFALSNVATTPLPAALPLFAGGLGLVGLLARRRKQKAAAIAAA